MLIRHHPELRDWYPNIGVAYPPPFPSQREIAHLLVKDIVFRPPSRIEFILAYATGQCGLMKEFEDEAFAAALYQSRWRLIGLPLATIGEINVEYQPLRLVLLDPWLER